MGRAAWAPSLSLLAGGEGANVLLIPGSRRHGRAGGIRGEIYTSCEDAPRQLCAF